MGGGGEGPTWSPGTAALGIAGCGGTGHGPARYDTRTTRSSGAQGRDPWRGGRSRRGRGGSWGAAVLLAPGVRWCQAVLYAGAPLSPVCLWCAPPPFGGPRVCGKFGFWPAPSPPAPAACGVPAALRRVTSQRFEFFFRLERCARSTNSEYAGLTKASSDPGSIRIL